MSLKNKIPERQIDQYFNYYSDESLTTAHRIVQGFCAFGIYFCLLGFSWSIPFPHLQFLGQYNSYFNWASFVIAFSIYYYSRLSPLLSYAMLFLALVFSYVLTLIAAKPFVGGLDKAQFYFLGFVLFQIIRQIALILAGKRSTFKTEFLFIWIGPIWIIHFLLKKFSINY